jgi:hypothetical protein
MNSLPAFHFLEPRPLIKALVKTVKVKINLGSWQGLSIISIGPRNGKIVGYKSNGKPIYAGSAAAQQLAAILQAKHTYTPAQQDVALVKWLMELGLQGAVDAEQVHLSKEGASLLQEAFSVTPQPLGGGKWKVAKASLLPHLGEPLRPSEEQETGWAAEMASGQYGDGSFPALSELKELPAGKFSGSHGNKLFESKGGHKWVFKAADPIIARAEEAACRLGRLLLGNLIPAVKYVEVQGKGGALIQILDGQTWQESSSQHSDPQMENLKKYKALIMKHQVVDWLISNHDSHAGNFLSQGGQLAAIDKGQSWKFLGKDKLEADYSPNPSHPIYNKFWEKIKSGEIDSAGLIEAVADVVNRADQISPEQFQLIVAPYVSTVSGWTHADPQAQLQKMLARLQNLRSDFEGFLSTELGKKVVLPKPETVQVAWETPPEGEPAAKPKAKPKHGPTKLEIPLTAVAAVTPVVPESPPKLKAVEVAPVVAGKPKAGWPLTKKGGKSVEVTIHTPGVVPASWWPPGVPAPGMKLTTAYKGKQYGLEVGENWEGKKPSFVVTYPDGKMAGFTSLNAAGDSLHLFNQGLPLTLSATEKKAKGISLGSKVFQLKLFEQELAEAAGKAEEPPAPVTQTVAELEEQKVVAPEQPVVAAMQLLHDWTNGQVVTGQFLPLEIQEWLVANSGKEHYTTAWDLPLPPGVAVKVSDSEVGTLILTARVSKVGKPEMWGWWEGLDGTVKNGVLGKLQIDVLAHKFELWAGESLADKLGSYKATAALAEKDKETLAKFPAGPPPEAILPPTAVVPENAPKFTEGPLAKGTVIKVKKKVPGYEKKQEVTLSVLQNGQLLVEIPGQTAQTFQTLSAASDHVWIVQKGYSDAADYKAKNKTNKVPSGGGWKFWGISPKEAPAASAAELGTGAGAVPAPVLPVPSVPEPGAATPAGAESLAPTIGGATLEFLEAAAYGTKIQTDDGNDNKTVYEKLFGGKWKVTLINKFASADTAEITTAEAYNMMQDEKIESWEGPGAPVPEEMVQITSAVDALAGALGPKDEYDWHPLKDVTGAVIDALPEGTTISWKSPWEKGSHQAEKTKGGQWTFTVAPNTEAGPYGTHPSIELLDHVIIGSEPKVLLPVFDYQAPKKPATTSGGPIPPPSLEQIKAYPLGTKVHVNVTSHPTYVYVKTEAGWSNLESGNTYKDLTVANSWKQPFYEITKIEVPEKSPKGLPTTEEEFAKLPVGTFIQTKGKYGHFYTYLKDSSDNWVLTENGATLSSGSNGKVFSDIQEETLDAWKAGSGKVPEKPEVPKGITTITLNDYPVGTVIQAQAGTSFYKYTKKPDGEWLVEGSQGTNSYPASLLATELFYEKVLEVAPPASKNPAAWEEFEKLAEGAFLAKQTVTISDYTPYLEDAAKFSALPVGTAIETKHKTGNTYTYTKKEPGKWEIVSGKGKTYAYEDVSALGDLNTETILSWQQPIGVPGFPENVHTDYSKFPEAVQKTLEKIKEGVVAGSKPTGGANHSTIEKPSGWPAWVPPPGVVISGEWQGKKFYLLNSQYGYFKNTDDPNVLIQFAVVGEDGVFHVGGSDENADDALAYALNMAGVGTSVTEVKEQLGLNKLSFPVGSNFYNLSGTQSPLAGKPVAQMTPAEKATKVKTSMALVDALKNHPLLQEGTLKFKKAKGTAMYVCLDGVEGASTKLYNALKELNVEHHIKNKGGIPKVNAQGAFVAIDGQVLQYTQVEVETTALEASSVKHAPSDPNWQTMPEAKAKSKKKTKAQLAAEKEAAAKFEAAKQKAVAIKAWGTTHPPVVDKGQLQTLAYLQKDFASYQIPVGVIARTAGEELVLSHKTHQKQFAYYLKILHEATPFQMETIETPWGEAVKLDVAGLQKALEQKFKVDIGKMITGPDGKEYPDGTTFQKKTFKHTVSDLISSEPGFYKIKEHVTDPVNLAFLQVVGTSPESMAQMKAIIAKYGLESPHPEPKLGSGSVVHSIFKKSLKKVFSVEEAYAVDVPEQPEEFVQSGLPSVDTGEYWSEVGDGSADLADVASIKPSLYGHVMRVGAPGELRDFCIRFRRVKDKQGKLYYEFTGDLVNFNSGKSELSTGTAQFGSILGSKGTEPDGGSTDVATFDPETGTHTEYTPKIPSAPTPGGFCGKTESGSSILVVPPSSSQDTFKNTFRVRIPATENPLSELREAFQKMGKDPDKMLAPINEDSDRIFKKSMLVRGLMGAKGWNEDSFSPMTMHDEAWLDGQLSKLGAKGKVEGLRVVKTFDNHISVIADDAEKFQKWSFPYVGAGLSGTFLQLIQGSGWASRKNCLVHGVWHSGQSPGPDIQSGGSKGVFCRVAGVNSVVSESYACQIIFSPRLFKRVDWWRYNTDGYGNTNSHQAHGSSVTYGKKRYETDLNGLNEILFEGGVGLKDIVAVVVDDSDERKQMIAALKKAGKTEINGKSLEDFIVGKVHKGVSVFGTAADFAKALGIAPVE